jgi:cobalt-precorrin 5A hydrolase/precorrin-3B C17-methyltransferase
MNTPKLIWGLGFNQGAQGLLLRLQQSGLVDAVVTVDATPAPAQVLREQWSQAKGFVVIGACGLVTRLVAPLLQDKLQDPAVVVLDPEGRFAVPLLGGHNAGADRLSEQLAAALDGTAVLTGHSSGRGLLALDSFGHSWGWRRGQGDWSALMQRAARQQPLQLHQDAGLALWQQCAAAESLALQSGATVSAAPPDLVISERLGPGCRWHPPRLWLGLGCERNTSLGLLERLLEQTLRDHGLAEAAVAGLASIDRKGDEPALLQLAAQRGWPLRLFSAAELAAVAVPNPSSLVAQEMGTASVAEASALLAAGSPGSAGSLTVAKTVLHAGERLDSAGAGEQGAATLAIAAAALQWAPQQGELHLVGSGPGSLALLTGDARTVLSRCTVWVGYGLYLDLLEPLRRPDQVRLDGQLTRERERCAQALELACQGVSVALISSGDSGIYGMAGLALELWLTLAEDARPRFAVHPGISALQLAAARCGAPLMHDFCTISLSDRLTPWEVIERRLIAAAQGDFVVALYNPRSLGRDWQLARAVELLGQGRPGSTPVALARQLGRADEAISLHTLETLPIEQVDMLTLVLVGNSSTRVESGQMVTPRGYPGAELS